MRADNFRLVAAGGLSEVMAQIKLWQEGVRFTTTPAPGIAPPPGPANEDKAWDRLIQEAPDDRHRQGRFCWCWRCRPNRRYR